MADKVDPVDMLGTKEYNVKFGIVNNVNYIKLFEEYKKLIESQEDSDPESISNIKLKLKEIESDENRKYNLPDETMKEVVRIAREELISGSPRRKIRLPLSQGKEPVGMAILDKEGSLSFGDKVKKFVSKHGPFEFRTGPFELPSGGKHKKSRKHKKRKSRKSSKKRKSFRRKSRRR